MDFPFGEEGAFQAQSIQYFYDRIFRGGGGGQAAKNDVLRRFENSADGCRADFFSAGYLVNEVFLRDNQDGFLLFAAIAQYAVSLIRTGESPSRMAF